MESPEGHLPYDLEDMEVAGDSFFALAFPVEMPEEFKRRVFAAGKSYVMGLSSTDYVLKHYSAQWRFPTPEDELSTEIPKLCRIVRQTAQKVISHFKDLPDIRDHACRFACGAAIYRLGSTFQAAVYCIRNGMHFEAVALSRLILEQIAWTSAIHRLHCDAEAFTKVNPQSCIGALKMIIPEAGKVYGELSESSHLHFERTLDYIKSHSQGITVYAQDLRLAAADAVRLVQLIDWMGIVGEHVYADSIANPVYTRLNAEGVRESNPDRHTVRDLEATKAFTQRSRG